MRVSHLVTSYGSDGPARTAAQAVLRARGRGEHVDLWALEVPALHEQIRAEGLHDIRGPLGALPDRAGVLSLASAMRRATNMDLLHVHASGTEPLLWAMMARARRPAVVTLHRLKDGPAPLGSVFDPATRLRYPAHLVLRAASRVAPLVVVTLSEVDRKRVQHALPGVRVETSPLAPAPPAGPHPGWIPWHDIPVKVLAVGHLLPRAGFDRLLRALAAPLLRDVDYQLCVVGTGPQEDSLVRLTAELGIEERVCFLGPVSAGYVYEQADLFVSPSHADASPLSLLEAMHTGLAVVASPTALHREILAGVDHALLSEDPDAWPVLLRALMTHREFRTVNALAALERARQYYGGHQLDRTSAAIYATLASCSP